MLIDVGMLRWRRAEANKCVNVYDIKEGRKEENGQSGCTQSSPLIISSILYHIWHLRSYLVELASLPRGKRCEHLACPKTRHTCFRHMHSLLRDEQPGVQHPSRQTRSCLPVSRIEIPSRKSREGPTVIVRPHLSRRLIWRI